jgi:hypothetical protein
MGSLVVLVSVLLLAATLLDEVAAADPEESVGAAEKSVDVLS